MFLLQTCMRGQLGPSNYVGSRQHPSSLAPRNFKMKTMRLSFIVAAIGSCWGGCVAPTEVGSTDAGDALNNEDRIDSGMLEPILCDRPFMIGSDRGCNAVVHGINFQYFPLDEGQHVTRIAPYFHGDGADELENMYQWSTIVPWAKSKGIMLIAPRAPNSQLAYGQLEVEAASSIASAVEVFIAFYKTPRDNLFYWSASGGSWYLTYAWIPLMGARLPGIYALKCGASGVSRAYTWDHAGELPRSKMKIFFIYGSKDFLADEIETSYQRFRYLKFDATRKIYDGATHCRHERDMPMIEFFSQNL